MFVAAAGCARALRSFFFFGSPSLRGEQSAERRGGLRGPRGGCEPPRTRLRGVSGSPLRSGTRASRRSTTAIFVRPSLTHLGPRLPFRFRTADRWSSRLPAHGSYCPYGGVRGAPRARPCEPDAQTPSLLLPTVPIRMAPSTSRVNIPLTGNLSLSTHRRGSELPGARRSVYGATCPAR